MAKRKMGCSQTVPVSRVWWPQIMAITLFFRTLPASPKNDLPKMITENHAKKAAEKNEAKLEFYSINPTILS